MPAMKHLAVSCAIYRHGAFVGQHGSWNRKDLTGYRVIFVPFPDGKPSGTPLEFLSGFVNEETH